MNFLLFNVFLNILKVVIVIISVQNVSNKAVQYFENERILILASLIITYLSSMINIKSHETPAWLVQCVQLHVLNSRLISLLRKSDEDDTFTQCHEQKKRNAQRDREIQC